MRRLYGFGDQWNYINYFRGSQLNTLINQAMNQNIVVGGTSAGMAIMGEYYFTAQNGTVTSSEALSNPYNSSVNVDNLFLEVDYLSNVITDHPMRRDVTLFLYPES